ncbi:MAG: ABC transporter substrate-binding protein [Anaerolineae bacterium]|nr:ABC transporter substrate-binding protein [Anaerolineae bacterium]
MPENYDFQSPVDYVPQRVISLVPSVTESLFDLNLGNRLIAITDYCNRPEEGVAKLPRIGGTKNPDLQRIIDLKPDLVILNDEENRREDAEKLQAAGVPIWVTGPRTVQQAIELLWSIMSVFEDASMTDRVRLIEGNAELTEKFQSEYAPVKVFVPIWRDPWMTINADTYMHDLLRVCGAQNVFAERERLYPLAADLGTADPQPMEGRDTRYPRITLEEVVAAQPELILLPDEPYLFGERDARELLELDIPAAINGHVYLVDGSLLSWHGTRLAFALQELPPAISAAREG